MPEYNLHFCTYKNNECRNFLPSSRQNYTRSAHFFVPEYQRNAFHCTTECTTNFAKSFLYFCGIWEWRSFIKPVLLRPATLLVSITRGRRSDLPKIFFHEKGLHSQCLFHTRNQSFKDQLIYINKYL